MHIHAAQPRHRQHRRGQDQPIGRNDHQCGLQCGELGLGRRFTKRERLQYGQVMCQRQFLHRRGLQIAAATSGSIGLGIHRHDLQALGQQGGQTRGGKFRCAREYDAGR